MAHMEVLLREDVDNLGQRGQVVRVRAGYGRNYLLPQGLAIKATPGNKRMIEEERRILTKREQRDRVAAQSQANNLDGVQLRFERRVGEHGILYGSVTALDIVEALTERGYKIERRRVLLREPIKQVGDYEVVVKLHREVAPTIKLSVRKEGEAEVAAQQAAAQQAAAQQAAAAAVEEAQPAATESDSADDTADEA